MARLVEAIAWLCTSFRSRIFSLLFHRAVVEVAQSDLLLATQDRQRSLGVRPRWEHQCPGSRSLGSEHARPRVHIKLINKEFGPLPLSAVRPSMVKAWTAKMKVEHPATS